MLSVDRAFRRRGIGECRVVSCRVPRPRIMISDKTDMARADGSEHACQAGNQGDGISGC